MEVNVHRDWHPLVDHHHTEKQTRVHSQFIQQHIQCSTTVAKIPQNPVPQLAKSTLTLAGGFLAAPLAAPLAAGALFPAAPLPPLVGDFGGGGTLLGALVAAAAFDGDLGAGLQWRVWHTSKKKKR